MQSRDTIAIALGDIMGKPGRRLRKQSPNTVAALVKSMAEVGQLQPIIVRLLSSSSHSSRYELIAGRHRMAAAARLKWSNINAIVIGRNETAELAQLIEIDENLMRAELSKAERAAHVAARKAIYEKLYPETKKGGDRKSAKAKNQSDNLADRSRKSFTADTAEKTGQPERSIQRDAARGEALGDELPRIIGTSLDKGVELDALAEMEPEERAPIIERAEAGEEVSAVVTEGPIVRKQISVVVEEAEPEAAPLQPQTPRQPKPIQSAPEGALLWVSCSILDTLPLFARPTAGAIYAINARYNGKGKKKTYSLEVSVVTMREIGEDHDNPFDADEDDVRVIASGVQTVAEAKAMAQADYDNTAGGHRGTVLIGKVMTTTAEEAPSG